MTAVSVATSAENNTNNRERFQPIFIKTEYIYYVLIYFYKESSEKNLNIGIPTQITKIQEFSNSFNSFIDKKRSKTIFKIKKYYIICV